MPEYSDINVIAEKRDISTVKRFLDHFLPKRKETADSYELPQYSNKPEIILNFDHEILSHCESNKHTEYLIIWKASEENKIEYGTICYLKDEHVIYSLSTNAENVGYAKELLGKLKAFLNSKHGYIGNEASPEVNNYSEFLEQEKMHEP